MQVLTPGMRPRGGMLGVNRFRVAPNHAAIPFHAHQLEDEVLVIETGRGVFRYGDEPVREVVAGDCIVCPAGAGKAHQLANASADEELVYLAIGAFEPQEVCTYPDTGKVLIRGLGRTIGRVAECDYMDGEPDMPRILDLAREQLG